VRLRQALEALGPIFVKFGQMLSTRRDLLPPDLADELAKLQDRVPPFPSEQAIAKLEAFYGKARSIRFSAASSAAGGFASVAQVHFAVLPNGDDVAVKVLRPGIEHIIANDILLMETAAGLLERLWSEGRG
jgi:ubiquinone biosynthesis protein